VWESLLPSAPPLRERRNRWRVKRTRVRKAIPAPLQLPRSRAGFLRGPPLAPFEVGD